MKETPAKRRRRATVSKSDIGDIVTRLEAVEKEIKRASDLLTQCEDILARVPQKSDFETYVSGESQDDYKNRLIESLSESVRNLSGR